MKIEESRKMKTGEWKSRRAKGRYCKKKYLENK
jgi:hypothetical protein